MVSLSALAFASKSLGYVDCTANFRVHHILEGWKQEVDTRLDPQQPLLPSILKGPSSAWVGVCTYAYEIKLFHAASLVACFAVLRISELLR